MNTPFPMSLKISMTPRLAPQLISAMHIRREEKRRFQKGFSIKAMAGFLTVVCLIGRTQVSQALALDGNAGKGVNYETGNGMNQLNCDSGNVKQIQADMKELTALHLQWIRVEVSMSSPSSLSCPKLPPFKA
jgi:hypothetical protein